MDGSEKWVYSAKQDWEQLPAGWKHVDVAGVSVDSDDRVYLLCRGDQPVIVYDRDGRFLTSWGQGQFTFRTHGITVGPDNAVYCTDDGDHTVKKFTPDGELLMVLGTPGQPSDTGYVFGDLDSIQRPGPPFNRPANLAVAPGGDLYVADGYGNCRVHRFSARGELIQSWGEPGSDPGQFRLPHGIWVHFDGRVLVCDRENDRIQIFSPDGEYLAEWTDVQRPTQLFVDAAGLVYVSELWWLAGQRSYRLGPIERDLPGRVSVLDSSGRVLARVGGETASGPGSFCAPHGICVDSQGSIYVAEVTWSFGVEPGLVPDDTPTLQKLVRQTPIAN